MSKFGQSSAPTLGFKTGKGSLANSQWKQDQLNWDTKEREERTT